MNLRGITPLIITYNEVANIHRCLSALSWAERIVVVDSNSNDGTLETLASYANTDVYTRDFDSFANQCNFGLKKIATEWTLSLDADYVLTPELVDEIGKLAETTATNGFSARFAYCIFGRPLRAALYPPRIVLYRTHLATYEDEGHCHRVRIDGRTESLRLEIHHDDRKSLSRWFQSQIGYARLEAEMLDQLGRREKRLTLRSQLRRRYLAVLIIPFYCLFVKGLVLSGWEGLYYTGQRAIAELMIALALLDRRLRRRDLGSVGEVAKPVSGKETTSPAHEPDFE